MLNRSEEPAIQDAVDFEVQLKPCEYYTLDNGLPVYSINAGAEEVVMLEWVFYAGNWYEQRNIQAATVSFMLKNGTTKRSAFAINDHFEFYGAYLNRSCHNETATVTLHCLAKHLPQLLPVVSELFTDCVFPEDELAIYKQNQKQRLEVNLKKCDFVANRLIDEYLFGIGHPYGKYTSPQDYDALQREELRLFYQQFYTQGKCLLFVAGKLPSNLQQQLNAALGHLPFHTGQLPNIQHVVQPAVEKKYQVINDAKGVQGAIRIGRPFPNRHHPDFSRIQVLNNVLGGFFGSRLMSNIREDKGYTYGIYSYLQNHIHDSAWMISTEAGREVCAATIAEVYKEMKLLREDPIDAAELSLVKNYMIGTILGELDGPFQIISRWKNYVLNDLPPAYFYNSLRTVRSITAGELQALAQQYLKEEDFYELVVI